MRHISGSNRHGGFSLLETTIGLAVMGVGLIMVAAIFPVALTQHRESLDQARALDMVSQAESVIRTRVRPDRLWFNTQNLSEGYDSPWYVMPMCNLEAGGAWSYAFGPGVDPMLAYTNSLNADFSDATIVPTAALHFRGTDVISDRILPLNDQLANESPNRLVWYGFYRQLGNGGQVYSVAICKQRRNQFFLQQDLSQPDSLINPRPQDPSLFPPQRLPLPWRVTLVQAGAVGELFINTATPLPAGSFTLDRLTPAGSKIMIRGVPDGMNITTPVPAGRVLTVTETFPVTPSRPSASVLVRENISDFSAPFDAWIFPPASENNELTGEYPILEWKESL